MIHELIRASDATAIGGFIATCADPILAHVNPAQLKTKNLIVSIHKDHSIFLRASPLQKTHGTGLNSHRKTSRNKPVC